MDPYACLKQAQDDLNAGDRESAACGLAAYVEWRAKGGFDPPCGPGTRAGDVMFAGLCRKLAGPFWDDKTFAEANPWCQSSQGETCDRTG